MITDKDAPVVAIIGCGNVGRALLAGLSRKWEPAAVRQIILVDRSAEHARRLAEEFGCRSSASMADAATDASIFVIAVKPRDVEPLCQTLIGVSWRGKTVISVAVGISIAQLQSSFPDAGVARAMPNLPMRVGAGVTCIFAESEVASQQAAQIFNTCGTTIRLNQETDLDPAMAVASCGPAFLALVAEAIAEGGMLGGLSREVAEQLVAETMFGTGAYLNRLEISAGELQNTVATPGGTTIEGLQFLKEAGVPEAFVKAVDRATQRARVMLSESTKGCDQAAS